MQGGLFVTNSFRSQNKSGYFATLQKPLMSYLVTVTFDIKGGDSKDYDMVYASFEKFGLRRKLKGESKEIQTNNHDRRNF